ncbi:TonB family protein [Cyanobacterium stanieri PCC 7202]|uniref:TonB family protein n=1 Tax=Cyanobacterium stanieri (strain ATCC 29140 / PCC 7202) TaxID=292563 RepID=K9YK63_CYASC|nr:TonB family protein [Cyanobacterium stanieri PCC 7202]
MVVTANRKASSLSKFKKPFKKINWALLTSIAVHGAFFALILPELNLNSESENADISGETNVIELNALEQTRLPDFSGPQRFANFNNLNVPTDMENGIDGIPIPNFDALPFSSYDNSFSSLPTPPPLPPISGSFDSNYGGSIVNIPAPRDLPAPPPISFNNNLPNPPSFNDSPITSNNFDNLEGNVIDIVPRSPEQEAEIRRAIFQGREDENIPSPRDVFNNRNSSIARNQTPDDETLVNIISNNPTINTDSENSTPRITSRDENVSDEEARKNYVAWLQDVNNPTPQEITMAGYYPQEACNGNIEGTVTYGINVNSDGTVVDHQLIKSSGYPLLNNQALEQIRARAFDNATGGNKPYHVYVEFQPSNDICGSTAANTPQNNTPVAPPTNNQTPTTPPPSDNPEPEINSSGVTPAQLNINPPANPPQTPESVRDILSNSQSQNTSSNGNDGQENSEEEENNGAASLGEEPIIPENTELEVEFID